MSYSHIMGPKVDEKGMRSNSGKSDMSLMRNLDFTSCLKKSVSVMFLIL